MKPQKHLAEPGLFYLITNIIFGAMLLSILGMLLLAHLWKPSPDSSPVKPAEAALERPGIMQMKPLNMDAVQQPETHHVTVISTDTAISETAKTARHDLTRNDLKKALQNHYLLQPQRADNFSRWILEAHEMTDVPIGFVTALIASESSFRYQVTSSAGAIGPAQVRPSDWQAFCHPLDLKDPRQNVLCGAKALHHLYQSPACNENWPCAFTHYNVGRGNLLKNRFPGAAERYIKRITTKLNMAPELWPMDVSLLP
ncbi:MAG: lytic transglycosylase domain-containing protein [Marinospirillum sp.]|uniref:lytic transglycosylase domain-containing protein n=1 Tax=Marinospirillum sp. TaxID=2183934 RepID=UPI0019DC0E9A|nr:lytic transglycosylase domain-containing protein [Marinospirillum sp.]MBE0508365.1 lytic transglycosylase domain-containing protein [Marinospirillum sp.]